MLRRKRQYEMDMCSGSLASKLLLFALPLLASTILQLLFNAADVIVVGRYAAQPAQALAAVGSNNALINLTINLFTGISIGANVVVAQDLGAGRRDTVSRSIHTAITLAIISGVALSIFGVICMRQLLEWMSSPEDVIGLATLYMRIYFLGMPGNLVYNFGAALLRAKGDTQRPLRYLTAAGIINVILNLILVIGFHLDVAGVAIATITSQYISAGLVLRCLMKEEGVFHLDLHRLSIDRAMMNRMLRIGLPAGFQGIMFSISNVIIQTGLNSFNDAAVVAGASASSSIEMFIYSIDSSISQTALTFVSQNYGAGKCKRVDRPFKPGILSGGYPGFQQSGLPFRRASGLPVRPGSAGGHRPSCIQNVLYAVLPVLERHYGRSRQHHPWVGLLLLPHGGHPGGRMRVPSGLGGLGIPRPPLSGIPLCLLPHLLDHHHGDPVRHLLCHP